MSAALTESMDVAQVVLYAFWFFFFALIYWLRMEDRREGYPTETDVQKQVGDQGNILIPAPKSFLLPSGEVVMAPNFERDRREVKGQRFYESSGAPLDPVGDPLTSNMGPGAWAQRADRVETTVEGKDLIVPMRADHDYGVTAGPDPRGYKVLGGDGQPVGTVKDLWVDRADTMVRYLELELNGGGTRLVPLTMAVVRRIGQTVEVYSLYASQFGNVPQLKNPERITVLEEEMISAYYAGGRMYADARRMGPLV